MTRMVLSVLGGDLYQAFRYNPYFSITMPVMLIVWIMLFKNKRMLLTCIMKYYTYATLLFGVLRNLPWFSFLAPTVVR